MKAIIIHQHGLKIETQKNNRYSISQSYFYEKNKIIFLDKNLIYTFYCSKCRRYSLNYDNHDNFNYYYMANPPESNTIYIKFQDNFNIGFILLGNEIEADEETKAFMDILAK